MFSATERISFPADLGRIEESFQGTNGKSILLIQQAHVDYNAQKAISELLKNLIERESLRLILVEGGWGDVNLSYLRTYADEKGRFEISEKYLKEGKISGEEYLEVTSDLDMDLWGIEARELYQENMEAFLKFRDEQPKLLAEIGKLETALEALKKTVFSDALFKFEEKRVSFAKGDLALSEYAGFLAREGEGVNSFPHLQKLLSLVGEERTFDPDKVQPEKEALIRALSKSVTKLEFDQIEIFKNRKSPEEETEFLNLLFSLYESNRTKLPNVQIANLKSYQKALKEITVSQPGALFDEIAKLEEAIENQLAVSAEEKELLRKTKMVELLRKLFELELSSEEFEKIEKESNVILDSSLIQQSIPLAKAFYVSAKKREAALIQNAVQKIEETGEQIAAVLVGGFHSERMVEAFKKHGYSLYVISPRFALEDSKNHQEKYFEILKYKWEASKQLASSNFNMTQGGVKANEIR